MRKLLWFLVALIVVAPLAAVALVFLAIQDAPAVDRVVTFTPQNIERAKRLFERNDPRRLRSGELYAITIAAPDVDLAANYLANRFGNGSARFNVDQGTGYLQLTTELPSNPIGRYLNIRATLAQTTALPRVQSLRIGRVPVPDWLSDFATRQVLQWLRGQPEYKADLDVIQIVTFSPRGMGLVYEWRDDLPDRVRASAGGDIDPDRLRRYQERLAQLSRSVPGAAVSLTTLMRPLFELAAERSAFSGAIEENRAALLVLAFHVLDQDLTAIAPQANQWPQPAPRTVTLDGRDDFAKHFIVSAAIAAHAGTALADAIGLHKELEDSRGGSGFSFNDLAADRAGTRLGEKASIDTTTARKLQQTLTAGLLETDIMPATADLPEFMQAAEFKRRYGGVGAPEYERMKADIERRIAALPLYR